MARIAAPIRDNRFLRLLFALVLAFVLFSSIFLRAGEHFWLGLSLTAGALGFVAILAEPREMRAALGRKSAGGWPEALGVGILSAVALYGIFLAGNQAARWVFSFGASDIESVYSLGLGTPRPLVAIVHSTRLILATVEVAKKCTHVEGLGRKKAALN